MDDVKLESFLDFSFLSQVQVSPGGRYVGFVRSQCDWEHNNYRSCLWVYDTVARSTRQLTDGGRERTFLWLDETTILFQGASSGKLLQPSTEYFVQSVLGGEAGPSFTVPLLVEDIQRLDADRFVIQAKTTLTPAEDLPESGADWIVLDELPFAENGAGYVSGIRHRLYLYSRSDETLTPITDERFQVRNRFAVHPNGTMVAYMGMEIDYKEVEKLGIFVYDVSSGETRQLLPLGRYKLRHVDFLGDKVLFTGADGSRYIWSQNAWFYTLDPQSGEEQVLFENEQMPINNTVGGDCRYGGGRLHKVAGEKIYHVITQEESAHLVCVQAGQPQKQITCRHGSVDCFDLWEDQAYMVAMRGTRLQELYRLDLKTGQEERLTDFHGSYHATHWITDPQPCHFTNHNGDLVQGWIIPPAHYTPGHRYPAILDIHGGPKTAYGDVYFHEMQLLSNRGYFVFYCNPRGSDGRGDEFGFLMTRYGTVDYEDLMQFTDVVLERYPDIDPAALGVTGGSYGGYMTNWIIGHTDRFAAAVSQRSISNWVTDEGASDWSYMYSPCRFGGVSARLKLEEAWASSPLKFADHAVTPTLFLHSDEDFRCPPGEAFQLYSNLIHRGVETRVCLFKGENHELSRSGSPRNRVKRLEELLAWMDAHLKH